MMRSERVWILLVGFFVLIGLALHSGRPNAQAPAATDFPKSITVSPGPKTNLFPHLMTKAEVLSALDLSMLVTTPDGRGYGYTWHRATSDLFLVRGWS